MKIILSLLFMFFMFLTACNDSVNGNFSGNTGVFPNSEGTYWKYRVADSLNSTTDSILITVKGKSNLSSGEEVRVWEITSPDTVDTNYVLLTGDSVKIYEDKNYLINNLKLVFPLQEGKTWIGDYILDSFYVSGRSDIAVPAGNFEQAYIIERNYGGFNEYLRMTIWFLPDIGIIKMHKRDIGLSFENETRELLEYNIK